jgi:hypothetical protein
MNRGSSRGGAPVADELLADAERADDQAAAATEPLEDQPLDLELLHRLPQPERLEQRAPAARDAHTTASRWCGFRIGLTSPGSMSKPSCAATAALPRRNSAYGATRASSRRAR